MNYREIAIEITTTVIQHYEEPSTARIVESILRKHFEGEKVKKIPQSRYRIAPKALGYRELLNQMLEEIDKRLTKLEGK